MRRSACIFLFFLSSIAHAAVRVTPEMPVADPSPAPQVGAQRPDAVATDGNDFLVAWAGCGVNVGIVKADGKLASLPRLAIARPETIRNLSVCWTGAVYLATWGEGSSSDEVKVVAATLSRDGTMASAPQIVAKPAFTQSGALASNGRRALLAYTRLGPIGAPSADVDGALFDANGALIKVDALLPVTGIISNYIDVVPHVATDGNEFAVLWRTGELDPRLMHTFHLMRVTEEGSPIGAPITFPRTEQTGEYGIAFGGGKYAVAAIEQHVIGIGQGQQPRLLRFIVDANAGQVTQSPSIDTGGWEASVLWNGSRFIAYWMDYSTTFFKLLTLPYESSTPAVVVSGTHIGHQPRLGFNGRNVFGVWSETVGAGERILAARFDSSATILADAEPSLVSTGWSRQLVPAVATSGHDSLVVWVDERGEYEQGRLLAARIALSGANIDRTPFEIAPSASMWVSPVVVFTGTTYLVVWEEPVTRDGPRLIVARPVGRDGSVGARVPLSKGWGAAAAASSSATLLAFNGDEGLIGYRFSPAGELLDIVPLAIGNGYAPKVGSNGTDFFVAWNVGSDYWQFPSPDALDVLGKRVTASGAVDASPLSIATGGSDQVLKAVASDGRDYIVVYDVVSFVPSLQALAVRRVLREGQLDGATAKDDGTIIAAGVAPSTIALTADATGFWAGWVEQSFPVTSLKLARTDGRGNPGEIVNLTFDSGMLPAISLAQPPHAPLQIVYARRVTDGPYPMTSRAFLRLFGEIPEGRLRAVGH